MNFTKKWISLGLPLLMSSMPSYSSCEYYVGAGLGPQMVNFKQKANFLNVTSGNARVVQSQDFAAQGCFASIFIGGGLKFTSYDPCRENLYLGIEANADWRRLMFKNTNLEFVFLNFTHTYYKLHRDLGISLLPGFLLTDCSLFFLRFGYANTRFSSDTNDISLQNLSSTHLNGFRYGLGMRYSFNPCWAFRIEYDQINYDRIQMSTLFPSQGTFATKDTRIKPRVGRFELGIVYTF